jgi:hypothetical protein
MNKNILLAPGAAFLLVAAGLGVTTSSASAADTCYQTVVAGAWAETVEHEAVTHEETVTIVDEPAWEETIPATEGNWENLSWFVWPGGPVEDAPALEDPNWHPVPAMPQGGPHEPVPGTVYNVSHSAAGLGSWFKYDGTFVTGTPEQVIDHPPVTHDETTTVIDEEAWTETVDHPAMTHQERVPCDNPPEVEGEQENTPRNNQPEVAGVQLLHQQAPSRPAVPAAQVPTAVDAGL